MATDKRIIKTKAAIKNAFMQLMTETEANKLTVSDIAAKALVNRSTFYLHYADVAAVMKDIETEIAAKIEECINDFDISDVTVRLILCWRIFQPCSTKKPRLKITLYSRKSQRAL